MGESKIQHYFDRLPRDVLYHIYTFDPTYHIDAWNRVLEQLAREIWVYRFFYTIKYTRDVSPYRFLRHEIYHVMEFIDTITVHSIYTQGEKHIIFGHNYRYDTSMFHHNEACVAVFIRIRSISTWARFRFHHLDWIHNHGDRSLTSFCLYLSQKMNEDQRILSQKKVAELWTNYTRS